jgi:hypothetical protein
MLDLTILIGYDDAIETQKGSEKTRMKTLVGAVSRMIKPVPQTG